MLLKLKMHHLGPADEFVLEFGKRLNLITGDNGLGKSFLLDNIWRTITGKWPAEINKRLPTGLMARPQQNVDADAGIVLTVSTETQDHEMYSIFRQNAQTWIEKKSERDKITSIVVYALVDGSFAVWDPARNFWDAEGPERPPAYVFTPNEVWDGLRDEKRGQLCNGLIADWAGWQKEKGLPFERLCLALKALSPSQKEIIKPGPLTRISLDDSRDIPTLKMPYGMDVPVLHASAGMRRIIALAYLLVWCWEEHNIASKMIGSGTTSQIIFLVDEIEAHLHPKWQRRIIDALLDVMNSFTDNASVQLIAATHSPLVLASVEPTFDNAKDAWFDLDLVTNGETPLVELTKRPFIRHGDVCNWLTSEAFDLSSARSLKAEQALEKAAGVLRDETISKEQALSVYEELRTVLGETDPFWLHWRYVAEKKGWLA